MKRIILLASLAVVGLVTAVTASAASMPLTSGRVGSGSATIARCDADGFTATSFTTSAGKVTSVTVGGIAPGCQGGRLSLSLTAGGSSVAVGGPVTVTGTSQTVTVTGSPDAWTVGGLEVVVIGP